MWKVLPKHHYFDHMREDTSKQGWNPKFNSTFAMEDFGGRVAVLNRSTHGETNAIRTIQRYIVGLAALFHDIVREKRNNQTQASPVRRSTRT